MPELTTEAALNILTGWLQDNIDCGSEIIFDNDEDNTDSAKLLPRVEQALQNVRDIHHLQLLQQASTD
ncbi:DUF957 domain-containing protein [Escherichia coli]|uniref:DUF957 domain-containing protein n=1 Tax=Serratia marcescens SM39 TaxID=1334564 RepID=A0AAT9E393_SERMA|nr:MULTISPECIES: DUF957 domain-containing protein [Enterobacterales]EHE8156675.1 DUF957 domain-containing protein [Escherichia coli]MBH3117316.1 DUF957 domain-containing protein [Serratia ureilytica]MBH3262333.1 DUF957 domain-containing protein [Serratia marcescens]MBS6088742.1 DUF957 domain-containing protein [Serratia marcescens]MCJ1030010.1 DUF957 domain-containing protein [Escherichia coli]